MHLLGTEPIRFFTHLFNGRSLISSCLLCGKGLVGTDNLLVLKIPYHQNPMLHFPLWPLLVCLHDDIYLFEELSLLFFCLSSD